MKTFKQTIEKPLLVIKYDESSPSPREWDNVGLFIAKESRYQTPDGKDSVIYEIMIETAEEAEGTVHHMELIKKAAKDQGIKITDIYPVVRYEHGGVSYTRGTRKGFDCSNCGFYIVTTNTLEDKTETTESIAEKIDQELKIYTQWANSEVYRFTLYDEAGEVADSCGGFYSIEDIRGNLPEDWKDEDLNQYLNA
jgi:hypothetical protein